LPDRKRVPTEKAALIFISWSGFRRNLPPRPATREKRHMNLYHCQIDIHHEAKALAFAGAVEQWMEYLKGRRAIVSWRLLRRKLNLASDNHRDFLLEIEFENLSQLDQAFRILGEHDEEVERLYRHVSSLIARSDLGLYRPFPDPERAERMALI
jgi:hypothetical protein